MESNEDFANADPDYEKYNLALKEIKEKESEVNELTPERLYNVIAEEFDKELTVRQKQLEEIQDKIFKAQKLLHLVRYVLISSYYNKRSLEHASSSEDPSSSVFDAQSRIHPAVKKLLGSNNSFEPLTARGKRKVYNKNNENNEASEDCQPPNIKKIKIKEVVSYNSRCNVVDSSHNSLKRKKTRHRIIVGNISKWMPSLENDNTTHKWMVYVRGSKEAPDLSHLIEKVIFHLHPSYKPHDVVEVSEYPFHLSRRGWGEFPLRVQIFFKCLLNKPVSIVHNLKLDKTYTGRQTLGNETVVDLYLHEDIPLKSEVKAEPDCDETVFKCTYDDGIFKDPHSFVNSQRSNVQIKEENHNYEDSVKSIKTENILMDTKEELLATSFEHDYCHDHETINEEVVDPIDTTLLDHSYSLPYSDSSDSVQNVQVEGSAIDDLKEQGDNNLVFGLDDSYGNERCVVEQNLSKDKCIVKTFTTATGQPIRVLPQSFNKVLLSNGNVVQIRLLKTTQSSGQNMDLNAVAGNASTAKENKTNCEIHRLHFPMKLFKNMGEVLPYVFQRLPLWNELTSKPGFRSIYPYVAGSKEEFLSWNIGRQLSSEWSRAKDVKNILQSQNFPESEKWNTKAFFMYARSHGYSPVAPYRVLLFKKPSKELELINACFSDSPQKPLFQNSVDNDVHVDVVDNKALTATQKNTSIVDISDSSLKHHCTFVKEAAFDCGIVLKSEEIAEGVTWNGAERIILEAVKCLASHLIRRARHHVVCQKNYSETTEINVNEIKIAMNDRPEIKSITDYQKKRLEKDFFS